MRYEYLVVKRNEMEVPLQDWLDALGEQGWRLSHVTILDEWIFMRGPLPFVMEKDVKIFPMGDSTFGVTQPTNRFDQRIVETLRRVLDV